MDIFEDSLIPEYIMWKENNPECFSWWSYVNMKADLDIALAFAKFYCPDVIIIDGCFILKDKYNEKTYKAWRKNCKGEKTSIEKMMNLYAIKDFFHINNVDDNKYDDKIIKLGSVLKFFWEMSFKQKFPDKFVCVDVFTESDEEAFITVYEI